MYKTIYSKPFQKAFNKLVKAGLKKNTQDKLKEVVNVLASGKRLDTSYRDHQLHGEFSMYRECHIQGDLLLVYQIIDDELVLVLIDIGTHSKLFG
jgi:mRNA interferase YafQ